MEDFEERLKQHSACFTSMVELIPSQYYTVKDGDPHLDSKYWKNKKLKTPKQAVKEATKKAKRSKLDPKSAQKSQNVEAKREEGRESENEESESGFEEAHGSQKRLRNGFSVEKVKSAGLNELRDRLKGRIGQYRVKRKARDFEELEPGERSEKRHKRLEKKHKKKDMRRRGKELKARKQVVGGGGEKRPSIEDESGRVVFSKFDFSSLSKDWEPKGTKKDYKKLLARAEAKQKKLEELKQKDEMKGEELQEKLKWQKAVEMAKGTKLKNDPKLLKRTVKRMEKKKTVSRKLWDQRVKQELQMKEKRQEMRQKHVRERVEQIKAKKMKKKAKKKGKRQPGF